MDLDQDGLVDAVVVQAEPEPLAITPKHKGTSKPPITPSTGPGACVKIVMAAKFDAAGGVRPLPRFSVARVNDRSARRRHYRGMHPAQSLLRRSWPLLALMASACSVESTGPTLDDLALLLAEQECASHLAGDCGEPAWPDEATCVEQRAAEIRSAYAETEALGRRFDPACAEALMGPPATDGCASFCSVLVGDKRLGEACSDEGIGSDCGVSLLCHEGACVESTRFVTGAEGEPCVDDAGELLRLCRTGLYCDRASSGTCRLGPTEGEPCIDWVCGMGSFCDVDDLVCRPLFAEGEPCANRFECESYTCNEGVCTAAEPLWCTEGAPPSIGCAESL